MPLSKAKALEYSYSQLIKLTRPLTYNLQRQIGDLICLKKESIGRKNQLAFLHHFIIQRDPLSKPTLERIEEKCLQRTFRILCVCVCRWVYLDTERDSWGKGKRTVFHIHIVHIHVRMHLRRVSK